jgi:hypothetical protein
MANKRSGTHGPCHLLVADFQTDGYQRGVCATFLFLAESRTRQSCQSVTTGAPTASDPYDAYVTSEWLIQHSEALISWAATAPMTRRITRTSGQSASREAQRY